MEQTNLSTSTTRLLTFVANPQTDAERIRKYGETYKSLKVVPENATGQQRTIDFALPYEERRGAFNAAVRIFMETDTVTDFIHKYSETNPNILGGILGWINPGMMGLRVDAHAQDQWVRFDGVRHWLVYPRRNGLVELNQPWVQIKGMAGNRLRLINPKNTEEARLGSILHSYMEELAVGITLVIPVTGSNWKNPETGEVKFLDGLQRRTRWLVNNIATPMEKGTFDFAAARAKYIEDKKNFAYTMSALEESTATFEEGQGLLQKRLNKELSGMTIRVDGKPVDLAEVQPGNYRIVAVDAKGATLRTHKPVVNVSRNNGARILLTYHQAGNLALETIALF